MHLHDDEGHTKRLSQGNADRILSRNYGVEVSDAGHDTLILSMKKNAVRKIS